MVPLATPVPSDYHWGLFMKIYTDPLVQAMLPVPKEDPGFYYLPTTDARYDLYLVMLSRMSSPIYPIVVPMWTTTPTALMNEVMMTNVQPFVVTNVEPKHTQLVAQMARVVPTAPRKLLMVGSPDVPLPQHAKRLTTRITDFNLADLAALPLENLGAAVVRRYMRKEWPINPAGSYDEGRTTRAATRPDR